jgi:glycosyltransferase involved in cell wall biosynthesis
MYRSNVLGGLLAKAAEKPVIWGIHASSLAPMRPSSRAVARLGGILARWTPDFIVNCSKRSAEVHGALGYSAAAGIVVPNGYDPSIWHPDEAARSLVRERLGLTPQDFVVGTVARWDPLKDIPNLLAALRIARGQEVPLRCFLIGAGLAPQNEVLMDEIRRHDCAGLVVPLGARSDLPALARAFDLHVLTSRTEAFPNVVAETMLSGVPNVVTDVGDAAIMVGDSGWVVPPENPSRLADAIVGAWGEWKEEPAAWAGRQEAARARIADNFSFEKMVAAYGEVWRKVASGNSHQSVLKPTAVQ